MSSFSGAFLRLVLRSAQLNDARSSPLASFIGASANVAKAPIEGLAGDSLG